MAEHALSAPEEQLIRAGARLANQLDLAGVADAALQALEEIFGASRAWLLLLDPASRTLVVQARRGDGLGSGDVRIAFDAGVFARCLDTRGIVFCSDLAAERGWPCPIDANASCAPALLAPLADREGTIGVLGCHAAAFTVADPPTPADLARFEAVATHATVGIRHARLFESIEQERQRLRRLLQQRRQLKDEVHHLRHQVHEVEAFSRIVGESPSLTAVLEQIRLVASADTTVLVHGETGTGKELIARAIHAESRRRANTFVALNCAALPESLVESELFGYERGAFTGALARKPGKFELADRGTLFLDEIGDLPLQAQAKLLRVLQEREVQRVGGTCAVPVNVRLIAATNKNLELELEAGTFRTDLYYRVSVFPIRMPPLRERQDDISLLAEYFMHRFAGQVHKPVEALSDAAVQRLLRYHWPGNVRELQNIIERAVILSSGTVIGPDAISIHRTRTPMRRAGDGRAASSAAAAPLSLDEAERRAIVRACVDTGWRISGPHGAASLLRLKPTTLHAKMKRLGIHRPTSQALSPSRASDTHDADVAAPASAVAAPDWNLV
jgi:transcriptional regulator with GAF, ATPase, and Fis domain